MRNVLERFGVWLTALVGFVLGWWFGTPEMVRILLLLMVADMTTGLIRAGMAHEITPEIAFKGVTRKAVILIVVTLSYYIGYTVSDPGSPMPIGLAVSAFYCASEGISMLDNAGAIGVPIPDVLKQLFATWATHGSATTATVIQNDVMTQAHEEDLERSLKG